MNRCRLCVIPDTRPDTAFVDGVCSACISYAKRPTVDWDARKASLLQLLDKHGGKCVVPSSGGKDSHFQALYLKSLGADVIAVTATTDHLSEIGARNIANLARHVDTIEVTPNQTVRRKISRYGLRTVGDISYGEHMAIWSTGFQWAAKLGRPLVFWGENPQAEMGGPLGTDEAIHMTRRWTSEFGGYLGLRATDLVGVDSITERDIQPYLLPPDDQMAKIEACFLGQFVPWDGAGNADYAKAHGFEWWYTDVEASVGRYESLDNHQTGIHEWFKFLKYGFMRPSDITSLAVRRGRMTRNEALAVIDDRERFPTTYLNVTFERVLAQIDLGFDGFVEICNRFLNESIFERSDAAWISPRRRAVAC